MHSCLSVEMHTWKVDALPVTHIAWQVTSIDKMPSLHLLLFKQLPIFSRDTAHWALFLPDEDGGAKGMLFHIIKESYASQNTQYRSRAYSVCNSNDLKYTLAINEINVNVAALDQACQRATRGRPFHLISRNCQHWVCEVVGDLARRENLGDIDVLGRMRDCGYVPLAEST
jgi:hypothetical protein